MSRKRVATKWPGPCRTDVPALQMPRVLPDPVDHRPLAVIGLELVALGVALIWASRMRRTR